MVKKFELDSTKSWEDNYRALEAHHIEETTKLYATIKELREQLEAFWRTDGTDEYGRVYPWDD